MEIGKRVLLAGGKWREMWVSAGALRIKSGVGKLLVYETLRSEVGRRDILRSAELRSAGSPFGYDQGRRGRLFPHDSCWFENI